MDATSYLLGKKAGGGSGTSDYSALTNKPSINGVTLSGDKTSEDLGIEVPTIPENMLKYKGHANSISEMPSQGQESETSLQVVSHLNHPYLDGLNNSISPNEAYTSKFNVFINSFPNYQNTYGKYFVTFISYYTSSTNSYFFSSRGFATDYPEQLYFYANSNGTNYNSTFVIGAYYDENKPVYEVTSSNLLRSNTLNFKKITEKTEFFQPTTLTSYDYWYGFDKPNNPGNVKMRLFLNCSIKWIKPNESLTQTIDSETFIYSGNTYTFTNDENYNPIPVMSASDVIPYDLYSVGNSEDIYVGTTNKKWLKLTDLTKITGYDATKTQTLKNVNGIIEWVNET